MPEKQTFVQVVDLATGAIEKIVNLREIEALTPEEKLELSRNKNLFVVTHRLEPIVRVELRKSAISAAQHFGPKPTAAPQPIVEVTKDPLPSTAPKTRKKK